MKTFDDLSEKEKQKFIAMSIITESSENDFRDVVNTTIRWATIGLILITSTIIGYAISGLFYLLTEKDVFLRLSGGLYQLTGLLGILFLIFILVFIICGLYEKQQSEKAIHLIFGYNKLNDMLDIKKEDLNKIKLRWTKVK